MLMAVINAHEGCNVVMCNIPNAFVQATMPIEHTRQERVMMKIAGVLVELLVKINPELHGPFVVHEKGRKALCIQVP